MLMELRAHTHSMMSLCNSPMVRASVPQEVMMRITPADALVPLRSSVRTQNPKRKNVFFIVVCCVIWCVVWCVSPPFTSKSIKVSGQKQVGWRLSRECA